MCPGAVPTNSQDPKSHSILMQARDVIGLAVTNAMALVIMAVSGSGPRFQVHAFHVVVGILKTIKSNCVIVKSF